MPEDPATGSANCVLMAYLTSLHQLEPGERSWKISQGVKMGRPSVLEGRTYKSDSETLTFVAGECSLFAKGKLVV